MTERKHPGAITYVDNEDGREWSEPIDDVPEAMRFGGNIPVVKVVRSVSGDSVYIVELGPSGEVLRSTIARR